MAALAVVAGGALVACFDLLHSTADVLTACELDAAHPGCRDAAKAETDFCAWTPEEANEHAVHACSWLGACEAPMGNNAFGPCYFRALLAYDCAANPNHHVQRAARGLWDCLQQVTSCDDVDMCIFHGAPPLPCGGPGVYSGCATAAPEVRRLCANDGVAPFPQARGENCALWGQTCAPTAGGAACAGESTGHLCKEECVGASLHWCASDDDGGPWTDRGIDCANNGAAECAGFPSQDAAQWVACKAESEGATCTPDASASCDDGRASMCPSGVLETLDCKVLLRSAAACSAGALSPPFDWTSPCVLAPSVCSADSCDDGGVLTSCERGAAFSVTCAQEGLGACRLLPGDPGAPERAACAPPSR